MDHQDSPTAPHDYSPLLDALRPQPTGGTIVTFRAGVDPSRQRSALSHACDSVYDVAEAGGEITSLRSGGSAVLLAEAGIAVISEREDAAAVAGTLQDDDATDEVRPEFWMFTLAPFADSATHTWGLQAVRADSSPFTGRGIRIAVLDTGLDRPPLSGPV